MKLRKLIAVLSCVLVLTFVLAGCADSKPDREPVKEETQTETAEENADLFTGGDNETEASDQTDIFVAGDEEAAAQSLDLSSGELTGIHHAQINVADYGTIDLELDADTAPITVTNFVKLAQDHFYDGLTFHRIISGFMIQGGDPNGNGTGGAEENITGEFASNGHENNISHERGVISMARSKDPDSASSQFFIMHADASYLDGEYAAFGHVTAGMDVVDKIAADAAPIDQNGTIEREKQPIIDSILILD